MLRTHIWARQVRLGHGDANQAHAYVRTVHVNAHACPHEYSSTYAFVSVCLYVSMHITRYVLHKHIHVVICVYRFVGGVQRGFVHGFVRRFACGFVRACLALVSVRGFVWDLLREPMCISARIVH